MKLAVQLYARARELAGQDHVELDLDEPVLVGDVRQALASTVPDLAPLAPGLLIAVGTDYADDGIVVSDGKTVACFPPVSGG
ncbi:MAG: molybdopterin converting factor subunit 1 [Planctomycetaceae bacterium]|nr:molybdopterin converting factor subunit 1 [Planctomycetaceae bacterium]